MTVLYPPSFYDAIRAGCQSSAAVVVPLVLDELGPVTSVVDVGCGEGWWAKAFEDRGIPALGIDGAYAESAYQGDTFMAADLSVPLPADAGRFDLAICLEVAEHLPEQRAASLVADLCRLADVVMFSAAIPGQPGTGHINCQWPAYWVERFAEHGYVGSGALRWQVWGNPAVEWWYQQNLLVFGQRSRVPDAEPHAVVHPVLWEALGPK